MANIPLASGTANPMAQKALQDAAKRKATTASPVSNVTAVPQTPKSPLMTEAAMRVRGLTAPTAQSGNFAKALDAEVKANQAIIDAGGVIKEPSDQLSLSRQAQYGSNAGMNITRTDENGNQYDVGQQIGQQNIQSGQNWNDIKQQAFERGDVAPSRSENLYANQATPTRGGVVETEGMKSGKTTVVTLPNGQKKEVPVNLKFQDYLADKHPGLLAQEDKMRRLNTIKDMVAQGGMLDDETMKFLQSAGLEPDVRSIQSAVDKIVQDADKYKEMNNVSGGYLMWQGEQGNDLVDQEKKSFGKVAGQKTTDPVTGEVIKEAVVDPNTITTGDIKPKTVDDMKQSGLSSYQSMMDDFKGLINAQIKQMNDSNKAMMENLQKREDMYQAEKERALARIEENSAHLQSIASFQKDNQLQQNELEAGKTDRQYGSRLDQMQSRQARYQGYLAAKFQSAGMADSGAGLELLGQYLTTGEMAINETSEAREDAKMAYLGRAQQIMSDYAEQAYKIESQRIESEDKVSFDMNEALFKIQDAKIQSLAKKDENTLMAIKELGQKELDLRKQSFSEVMSLADQKMKEMQFNQQVIQDAIKNSQWDQSFTLDISREQRAIDEGRTAQTGNLWVDGQNTGQRALSGLSYDQNVRAFERGIVESDRNFARGAYESDRNFSRGVYESDRAYEMSQMNQQMALDEFKIKYADSPMVTKYLNPDDVMAMGNYTYETKNGGVQSLGNRVANAIEKAAKNTDSAYQCVQFVRDILPDLPGGLFTLADKIKKLSNSQYSIDAPQEGAVVVLDWKTPQEKGQNLGADEYAGHIATVKRVEKDGFWITDYNGSGGKGKLGEKFIKTNNGNIKGYWMSPSLKGGGKQQNTSVWANVPKDYRSLVSGKANQFDAEPVVKDFSNLQTQITAVRNIPDNTTNPSDDQALIYAFARAMDPTSAVKEGEYETAKKYSQSALGGSAKSVEQFIAGKGFLTEEARKNIKSTIENRYSAQEKAYNNLRGSYMNSINSQAGTDVAESILQDYKMGPSNQYASQLQQGEILVKDKDGNIGAIPANEYDPALYTKVQ